jgi:hypothetical protein
VARRKKGRENGVIARKNAPQRGEIATNGRNEAAAIAEVLERRAPANLLSRRQRAKRLVQCMASPPGIDTRWTISGPLR